jgi:hypothetical protein
MITLILKTKPKVKEGDGPKFADERMLSANLGVFEFKEI